jgi:hypothetical protein
VQVHKVESVEGSYIANQLNQGSLKTLISYDKGAMWWTLNLFVAQPPVVSDLTGGGGAVVLRLGFCSDPL